MLMNQTILHSEYRTTMNNIALLYVLSNIQFRYKIHIIEQINMYND